MTERTEEYSMPQDGHGIPYMGILLEPPAKVLLRDPCPLGLPEMLTYFARANPATQDVRPANVPAHRRRATVTDQTAC